MMSVEATLKWNEKTRINLQQAPEKVMRMIARDTLDETKSAKVMPNSSRATYKKPPGHRSGALEMSAYENGVQGNMDTGFYIGNFTDYAMYVYPRQAGSHWHWTNPNTKTKWFEHIWTTKGSGIIDRAIKECKI